MWIYIRNSGLSGKIHWRNMVVFTPPMILGITLSLWTTVERLFSTSHRHSPVDISKIQLLPKLEIIIARGVHFISSCIVPPKEITPAHFPGEVIWTWAGTGGFLLIVILITITVKWGGINKIAVLTLLIATITSIPVLGLTEEQMLPVDRYSYLLSFFILLTLGLQFSHLPFKNKRILTYGLTSYIGLMSVIGLKSHKQWNNTEELIANLYNTKIVRGSEYWRAGVTSNLALYYASEGHYLYSLYLIEEITCTTLPTHQVKSNLKKIVIHMAAKKALEGDYGAVEFLEILQREGKLKIPKS
jgi:hypothetical protein